jgi:hypothetical protein
MTSTHGTGRWVFGEYIVYATDAYTAQRIYEVASNCPDKSVLFGPVILDDGCGNWVQILPRRQRATRKDRAAIL